MLKGTQGHRKPHQGEKTGRGLVKKVGRAAKKTGKFFGTLIGGGLLIVTPLKAGSQVETKSQEKTSPDKQTQMLMNARGELPANTYVVLTTDGEGKKATGSKTSLEPEPNPNQMTFGDKFCETTVENNTIRITVEFKGKIHGFDIETSIFGDMGIPNASEKDIAAKAYDKTSSKVHFITRRGIVSILLDLKDIRKGKVGDSVPTDVYSISQPLKAGDLFTKEGSFYISGDGSRIFIACPEGFLIVKPEYDNYFPWSSFGKKLPIVNPTIDSENYMEKELVRIRDPTMTKDNGNYYNSLGQN